MTNILILPEHWDTKTQQIVIPNFRLMTDEKKELKQYLTTQSSKLDTLVTTIQTDFNNTGKTNISTDLLKLVINRFKFPEKYIVQTETEKTPAFFEFVDMFLKEYPSSTTEKGYYQYSHSQKFTVTRDDADTIYLNKTELHQLKDVDLSKIPHLDCVRDWFLLLAWTGCRFLDFGKLTKTDIKDGFITFRQQKTNNKIVISLHLVVTEILEKYNYNMPAEISNQKFNEYIKEVCEFSEINSIETITRTVDGKLVSEKFEKWEQVSSHTGRRSFCTNMYKQVLPALMIMSISGLKTKKSFLKYIKVKQHEHAEMMKKACKNMYK